MSVKNQRLEVNSKYFDPAFEVRELDIDEAIEPTRSREGWIKDFLLVGSCKNDNACIVVEPIHLH